MRRGAAPRDPLTLIYRIYRHALPGVRCELERWRRRAEQIPDRELRRQAISSITTKRFHCEGGAVYATVDPPQKRILIPLIVAFQTISDYLDNLCDRSTSLDGEDFRQLHQAMLDAVEPSAAAGDYYARRREREDAGYLAALVRTCQSCLERLPSYPVVRRPVRELVALYGDLQVYKHIHPAQREPRLLAWWEQQGKCFEALRWNEFAAATGSTLGVFMLFVTAARAGVPAETPRRVRGAYFPYLCGLHILLDYLIDQEEDRAGGDLNFCSYYATPDEAAERLSLIAGKARNAVRGLEDAAFHGMIIEGLLALYLSDEKLLGQPHGRRLARRLTQDRPLARLLYAMNRIRQCLHGRAAPRRE